MLSIATHSYILYYIYFICSPTLHLTYLNACQDATFIDDMVDMEEDPLESLLGGDGDAASVADGGAAGSTGMKLTETGIRVLLGRPERRPKPLLELHCIGCGRTTWSYCKFLTMDFVEWATQSL